MQKISGSRIVTFDLLRGYFILIIIIDHLQRWPGIFDWFTGQGRLWVSAAQGFIIISGVMIGLIRAYKDKSLPLKIVTRKLWKRAFILYLWSIATSMIALVLVSYWQTTFSPYPPGTDSINNPDNILGAVLQFANLSAVFGWTNFLGLYAVFLFFSPLAIWLLRTGKWWLLLIISLSIWGVGIGRDNMFMTWQILFFSGSIFGYYYNQLQPKFDAYKYKNIINNTIVSITIIVLAISTLIIFGWPFVKSSFSPISLDQFINFRTVIDPYFNRVDLPLTMFAVSMIVFLGIFIIFNKFQHQIYNKLGWLLLPFGRHSLFVYILQGIIVVIVAGLIPKQSNIIINALITILTILVIWALTTKPAFKFLHKIIPS